MDPFIKFFQQYGAIFQLVHIVLTIVLAVLGIIAYIKYFKKSEVKVEKAKKPKLPKVKAEKDDHYNLVIKDEHNVIIFNQNYKSKLKAKAAISKNIKALRKASKSPKSYKISKLK